MSDQQTTAQRHIDIAAEIVSAYVAHNRVPTTELAALIASVHATLANLVGTAIAVPDTPERATPAQVRRSISHEALISFEDGKSYRALKRHLTLRGLSPEAYREKWGLPHDYPMTAAGYSAARSTLAKSLGLGRKRTAATSEPAPSPVPPAPPVSIEAPRRRGRPRKVTETA